MLSMFSNASDRAVEQHYLPEDLLHTKIAILVAICFCLIFIGNDYMFFGTGPQFFQTVLVRVVFVSLSAGALVLLRRIKSSRQHERLVFVWVCLYILLNNYINLTRQNDNINFTYLNTLVVVLILIYFPASLIKKGILSGSLALSDLAILVFIKIPPYAASFEVIFFSYTIALILGFVIASKLHKIRNEQYHALIKEHEMRLELEQVAYIDYLTGTLNRRKFFQLGDDQFGLFTQNGTMFSVIMLDVDHFKRLNDKFGHAAGDSILIALTKAIKDYSRSEDILGRLGGEEFALIIPGTTLEIARDIAERLCSVCAGTHVFFNKKVLQITVSVGVTEVGGKDASFNDVLKRADQALYLAKGKGRNQVQYGIAE